MTAPAHEAKPLLSICIPTYNRDVWLDNSLRIIGAEMTDLAAQVEIIVSNNASTDRTDLVISKHQGSFPFKYNRNAVNIGGLCNFRKSIGLASGKYLWILGDDDFLVAGFLKKFLALISANPEIPFYFVKMDVWQPDQEYEYGDQINPKTYVDTHYHVLQHLEYTYHAELKEIATFSRGYFNAISNFILLRGDYLLAFKDGMSEAEAFTSIESTFPHCYYIAKYLMHRPCIDIATPGLACSSTVGWRRYYEITWLKWFPELIILMVENGADRRDALDGRRNIIRSKYGMMLPKALKGEMARGEYFSWRRFILDNYRIKEFWIIILSIINRQCFKAMRAGWRRIRQLWPGRSPAGH